MSMELLVRKVKNDGSISEQGVQREDDQRFQNVLDDFARACGMDIADATNQQVWDFVTKELWRYMKAIARDKAHSDAIAAAQAAINDRFVE